MPTTTNSFDEDLNSNELSFSGELVDVEADAPQYTGDPNDYDDMLDFILGHSDEYPRRPDEYSGYGTDETGQAYQNYELMSNEERRAAWDTWYQAVDAYGYDNLNRPDAMAYVATGFRLGYLTAEEADELYDMAWAEYAAANGWELQDDGVTWRKETDGGGGRTIVETKTQPSFADGYFGESGEWDGNIGESLGPGTWTDYGLNPLLHQENYTREVEEPNGLRGAFNTIMQDIAPVVVKGTLSWAVGQALNPLIINALTGAGMSTAAATAAASAVSSQVANGLINGEVSLEGALISAAGGYISGGGMSDLLGEASGALDGVIDSINSGVDAISFGNEFIAGMVQAGATNALMQYALTGEIDPIQLAAVLAQNGLTSELKQVVEDGRANGSITDEDARMLAEMEEWDQIEAEFVAADIKDPFLNPNYEYVSDDNSLMVNTVTGEVYNNAGESQGQFTDLDINNDGILGADDLQEVTVDAEQIPEMNLDQGYADTDRFFTPNGRYYVSEDGTIYSARDITYGDYNGETTMFVNGQPVGWMEEVTYTADGRFVTAKPWESIYIESEGRYLTEEEWNLLSQDRRETAIAQLSDVEYDSVYNAETGQIEFVDQGMEQITDGSSGQVMGDDLVGAPSGNVNPGDYVNSEGQTVRYHGTIYGSVDENGNWVPGTVGQEQDVYWNEETQSYVTKSGTVINMETVPEDSIETVEEVEEVVEAEDAVDGQATDTEEADGPEVDDIAEESGTDTSILDDVVDSATGGSQQGDPGGQSGGGESGGAQGESSDNRTTWQRNKDFIVQQVENGSATPAQQDWYDRWVASGSPATKADMKTWEEINNSEVVDSGGEQPTDSGSSGGETANPTWTNNKNFIISQVEAGTATAAQQDWYDRWVASGSPDSRDGMKTWEEINEASGDSGDGNADGLGNAIGDIIGGLGEGIEDGEGLGFGPDGSGGATGGGQGSAGAGGGTGTSGGTDDGDSDNTGGGDNQGGSGETAGGGTGQAGGGQGNEGTGGGNTGTGGGGGGTGEGGPGGNGGGGLMGGGNPTTFTPQWSPLNPLTPFNPTEAKAVAQLLNTIRSKNGMLS